MRNYKKMISREMMAAVACIVGSIVLYVLLTITSKPVSPVSEDGKIIRPAYGADAQQIEVHVEGIGTEKIPVNLVVEAREYSRPDAEAVFAQIMDGMEQEIRGENPTLMEVTKSLALPSWLEEYGVRLRWYSSEPETLDAQGKINPVIWEEDGRQEWNVYLRVQLSTGAHKAEYELPVRIIPPNQSEQEQLTRKFIQIIRKGEERQQAEPYLQLPIEYEGKILHYGTKEESGYAILLVLGVLLAVLCYAKTEADIREQEKKREKELLLDHAELLSKLMIFIGAGMTVRGAWERMVKDYEEGVTSGQQARRAAYEEMGQTYYHLKSGLPEGEAYAQFGRRCRLQPYLKLSSLLEQNRKTGMKNLRGIMETETRDAFEQRKNLARRLGEEAGTKLLLPLFLMLGIVMVMIMVPAMLTMG